MNLNEKIVVIFAGLIASVCVWYVIQFVIFSINLAIAE